MRILANETFPGEAVDALRDRGHDMAWVRMDAPGSTDAEVLARAQAESRLLVTLDKDFGELAFRALHPAAKGIVLFRLSAPSPGRFARAVVAALESRDDWSEYFAVVEDRRIRMTPLPQKG